MILPALTSAHHTSDDPCELTEHPHPSSQTKRGRNVFRTYSGAHPGALLSMSPD